MTLPRCSFQDRLFGLIDKDGDGLVTHEEYSSCIQGCLEDPWSALTHMANGGGNQTVDRANATAFVTDVARAWCEGGGGGGMPCARRPYTFRGPRYWYGSG